MSSDAVTNLGSWNIGHSLPLKAVFVDTSGNPATPTAIRLVLTPQGASASTVISTGFDVSGGANSPVYRYLPAVAGPLTGRFEGDTVSIANAWVQRFAITIMGDPNYPHG